MSNKSENNNRGKDTVMKQLELRTYSRQEIADILNVNIKDSNHFKRNVENKLNNWGYSYKYSSRQFEILRAPTTADERLSEIMQRAYGMDIRIDTISFAAFIYSLVVFPEFLIMPWEERSKWLKEEFDVTVSDRTLRSWMSKFINAGFIVKDESFRMRWVTGYEKGVKYREAIDGDPRMEEFADRYQKDKDRLLKAYSHLSSKERWQKVTKDMWDKYHCCIYYCTGFQFSAWNNELDSNTLQEVIELVNEIALRAPAESNCVIQQSIEIVSK